MERQKQRFAAVLVFGGIAFYFGLTHFNTVTHWISGLAGLCTPAVIGGIIAFLLNVPMTAIENGLKKLLYRRHPEKAGKALRMLSLLLTFVCIIVVVALAVLMLIPELRKSIMSVIAQIQQSLPALLDWLYSIGIDTTWMEQQLAAIDLAAIDFKELASQMITGASNMLGTLVGVVSATVSVLGNALFSTVIALYILIDKENLSRQCRKLLYAFVSPAVGDQVWHVGSLIREVFGKFLGGQSIESCLLGFLMFLALSAFRIPYASLIAVLTAVCAFIPYIGAFLSCGIGVALILLVSVALLDDLFHQTSLEVAFFYLVGLAACCIFLYIFFTMVWIWLAYLCFVAYTAWCVSRLRKSGAYPYACGACGAKMRTKGVCPHCGAINE